MIDEIRVAFTELPWLWGVVGAAIVLGGLIGLWIGRLGSPAPDRRLVRRVREENASYLRGVNYILSHETDAAIEELTKVVQVNTETVETYFALGSLFRQKGEIERAIRIHQNLIVRPNLDEKTRTEALFELGLDYRKAGLHKRALTTLEEVLARAPAHVGAYRELVGLYEQAGAWGEAYEMLRKLVKRTGENSASVLSHLQCEIGRAQLEAENAVGARRTLKRALSDDSRSLHAHLLMGDIELKEKDPRAAIQLWQRALGHVGASFSGLIYPRLEHAYFDLGDVPKFEALLRERIVDDETDIFARLALARLLAKKGKTREAIEELRRALEYKPDFIEARKEMGEILVASGSPEDLRREYEELLQVLISPLRSFQCAHCGFETEEMLWKCPQCRRWDSVGYKRFWRDRRARRRVA